LPVIALVVLAARSRWRQGAWLAASLLVVVLVLSLGPVLTVGGRPLVALPFATAKFPLLGDMLPARLSLFAALLAACLVAVWLGLERPAWLRIGAAGIVLGSLMPNLFLSGPVTGAWAISRTVRFSTANAPAGFVAAAGWRDLVRWGETVLVLPSGDRTDSLYWQARGDMGFRLAIPATPFVPPRLATEPVVVELVARSRPDVHGMRLEAARLRAFLARNHVGAVALTNGASRRWRRVAAFATGARPRLLTGSLLYTARRLRPLAASGDRTSVGRGATRLIAWLRYDGRRAHVEVELKRASAVSVSAPAADAERLAAAVNRDGDAAVVFTEWQRGASLLCVATHAPEGRWRLVTLDRRKQPIWSPRLRVTPNGTVVVSWLDAASPLRLVRVAVRLPQGRWQQTQTLETADGLASVDIAAKGAASAILVWHDTLAGEQRIRLATYTPKGWHPPTTIGSTLANVVHLRIASPGAARIKWTAQDKRHTWSGRSPGEEASADNDSRQTGRLPSPGVLPG
jgi:hypothetical protein